MAAPFLLGVNYWPRRRAMYMWQELDLGEVAEELHQIAELGLTHVRLFLLWQSFQPEIDRIDRAAIDGLVAVCDLAAARGLSVEPTLFCGHMSGPNWAPEWLIDPAPRPPDARPVVVLGRGVVPGTIANIYVEPHAIAAAERQIAAVCGALAGHPAVWAYSLGNEPDLFCIPPDPAAGRAWVDRMARAIRAADPKPVTIGVHTSSLTNDCNLRVDDLAPVTDFSVMHGYSIYSAIARRPLDPDWVPFTCALTAALAGRPVLCEELGLCTHDAPSGMRDERFHASEEDGAIWWSEVLPRLVSAGATGAFAWCFADYPSPLWDRPPCDTVPHERRFGLVRGDGSEKPMAKAIRDFARTRPQVIEGPRIEIDRERYFRDPWTEMALLYKGWPPASR